MARRGGGQSIRRRPSHAKPPTTKRIAESCSALPLTHLRATAPAAMTINPWVLFAPDRKQGAFIAVEASKSPWMQPVEPHTIQPCLASESNEISEAKYATVSAAAASRTPSGGIHPSVPAAAATAGWAHRDAPADTMNPVCLVRPKPRPTGSRRTGLVIASRDPAPNVVATASPGVGGTNQQGRNNGAAVQGVDSSPSPERVRQRTREHQPRPRGARPCRGAWSENRERPTLRCARPRV